MTPVSVVPRTVIVAAGVIMATLSFAILPDTYLNVPTDTLTARAPLEVAGSYIKSSISRSEFSMTVTVVSSLNKIPTTPVSVVLMKSSIFIT